MARGTIVGMLVAAGLAGCAHVEAPSGGPEDRAAPELVVTRPAGGTVDPTWRDPVFLVFDERVSERGIDQAVQVSPRTSGVIVRHSGDELRVELREGWRPNTIYQITVMPGLRDLFNNEVREPVRLVFSTGPGIPDTRLTGRVVDRITGRAVADHRVEAILAADSLVYATATDSAGAFDIANVPPGDYLLRGYDDMNANRALDGFEPRDTVIVSIGDDPREASLSIVLPDSTAPRVATATVAGRVVTVTFDDHLDPAAAPGPMDVTVRDPTGARVPVARVAVGALTDVTVPGAPVPPDTMGPDTITVKPADADSAAAGVPQVDTVQRDGSPSDTLGAPVDRPGTDRAGARDRAPAEGRLPARELSVELAPDAVLVPGGEYTIEVRGVTNVVGLTTDVRATFTVPEAEPAPTGASGAAPGQENPNRID